MTLSLQYDVVGSGVDVLLGLGRWFDMQQIFCHHRNHFQVQGLQVQEGMALACSRWSLFRLLEWEFLSALADENFRLINHLWAPPPSFLRDSQRRRKHRVPPPMDRASSFSSITDSTLSLNIITVTLNMDTVNFLGISIVGQSNKVARVRSLGWGWMLSAFIFLKKNNLICTTCSEGTVSVGVSGTRWMNKAGYTAKDAPSMRTFHLWK